MSLYKSYESKPVTAPLPRETYDHYHKGMPLLDGYAVGLEYCPKQKLTAYRAQWKAWMLEHDKREWPYHVTSYIEKLKREDRKADLLELHTEA